MNPSIHSQNEKSAPYYYVTLLACGFLLAGCEGVEGFGLYQSPLVLFEEVAVIPPASEYFHATYVVKKIHKDRSSFGNSFYFHMNEISEYDCNNPPDAKISIRLSVEDRILVDEKFNFNKLSFWYRENNPNYENKVKYSCLGYLNRERGLKFDVDKIYSNTVVEITCECQNLKNRTIHIMLTDNSVTARQKMYEKETGKRAPLGYGMDSL